VLKPPREAWGFVEANMEEKIDIEVTHLNHEFTFIGENRAMEFWVNVRIPKYQQDYEVYIYGLLDSSSRFYVSLFDGAVIFVKSVDEIMNFLVSYLRHQFVKNINKFIEKWEFIEDWEFKDFNNVAIAEYISRITGVEKYNTIHYSGWEALIQNLNTNLPFFMQSQYSLNQQFPMPISGSPNLIFYNSSSTTTPYSVGTGAGIWRRYGY